MKFEQLTIPGAWLVIPECHTDNRGLFARLFCAREFAEHNLPIEFVQSSVSFNVHEGTIRGMHFQRAPSREDKMVRCSRGVMRDVLLDLRPRSPTYCRHVSIDLSEDNRQLVFVPAGVAHGFQTLRDDTEVEYHMTDFYSPELYGGVRWNDPSFGIEWPLPVSMIHPRDASYPDFRTTAGPHDA